MEAPLETLVTMSDIYEARERIAPVVRRTPLTSVESIDRVCGTTVPSNASLPKEQATRDYGAEVRFEVGALDDAFVAAKRWAAEHGAVFAPPFDDPHIIAGQGTLGLELHEQAPEARTILVPVGGGGLLCGTAVAAKGVRPGIRVIATEPAAADDAARSFAAGKIMPVAPTLTIADGLRTTLGERNFPLIQQHVDGIVTVSEESIVVAMRRIWEVLKIIIEPSCAVPYAAIIEGKIDVAGKRVGLILTGGNVDLDALPWLAK